MRDFEAAARERLHPDAYAYYAAGAGDEVAAGEAVAAWRRWRIRPRVLTDVSRVDTAVELLGRALPHPVLAGPTALHALAHPDGEVATARGVRGAGGLLVLSSRASAPVEAVAAAAGPWWFQVYVLRDRGVTREQVARAVAAGAQALVLTVDAPVLGRKPRVRGPLPLADPSLGPAARTPGLTQDPALGPADIGRLAELSGLPVLVKGVLRGDDAERCVAAGAAGVVVSNHGGRQLDRAVSTAHALPEVVAAVAGRVPVLVDGGLRTGEDVLTALALGARAVLLGRPVLWALAAAGAAGVAELLTAYTDELAHAMALAGAAGVADLTPDLVVPFSRFS